MLAQENEEESQMKPFEVTSGMTNMRGVFYPTGHMVLMFPTEPHARHACSMGGSGPPFERETTDEKRGTPVRRGTACRVSRPCPR